MLTGICMNCGAAYCGWALREERHQTCLECGSLLKVVEYNQAGMHNRVLKRWMAIGERPFAGEQKKSASNPFGQGDDLYYDESR